MGVCVTENSKYIITELMAGKSLEAALYQNKERKLLGQRRHQSMSLKTKMNLLYQVVQGMVYLQKLDPPILHRDLKPS